MFREVEAPCLGMQEQDFSACVGEGQAQILVQVGSNACRACGVCASVDRQALVNHNQELYEAGHQDELTKLPNLRGLVEAFQQNVETGDTFGVLMVDVQKFKQINEQFTHSAGDAALNFVGAFLQSELRDEDYIARLQSPVAEAEDEPELSPEYNSLISRKGGDEFVIFISYASREQNGRTTSMQAKVEQVQNRLYHRFAANPTVQRCNELLKGEGVSLGLHIGSAVFDPENPSTLADLLSEGDAKPALTSLQAAEAYEVTQLFVQGAAELNDKMQQSHTEPRP